MSARTQPTTQTSSSLKTDGHRELWSGWWVLLLVALAAVGIITPTAFLGNASGHDIEFHLASWIDVHGQWKEGVLFPRWAEWANWGYGEPRFIFYPPASWILGALLGSAVPWKATTVWFIFICVVAGGMSAWWLACDWMGGPEAAAAALFYAVNPYQVANIYYRSDYAELLAFVFFPLLVRGALKSLRDRWTSVTLVAIPFAAMWLSNAPAGVLATYSLCLILFAGIFVSRNWKAAIPGMAGMALGFGLAAFYIVPAAVEQRWVQIREVISSDLQPFHNFLFIKNGDPEFVYFNLRISFVALGMIFLTALAAVFVARRRREIPQLWWTLIVLAIVCSLLMFHESRLFWNLLPKLEFIQFPWRWLGPLGLVFALFAAAAYPRGKWGRPAWLASVSLVLLGAAVAMGSDTWWDTEDANYIVDSIHSGRGYEGTDEYSPVGCDRYDLAESEPRISRLEPTTRMLVPVGPGAVQIKKWTAERIEFDVDARLPETLVLRRLNYPAWNEFVDATPAHLTSRANTGEMELALPEGRHAVEIRFERTADRTVGGSISWASLLVLAGIEYARRKKRRARFQGSRRPRLANR